MHIKNPSYFITFSPNSFITCKKKNTQVEDRPTDRINLNNKDQKSYSLDLV